MELRQVRYFVAVADAGSFSAGASRAYVTQPTLSAAIAALEAEVGGALFERRARGAVPTPLGERALAHARAILRETEFLKATGRRESPQKPFRLGVLSTLPPRLVTKALKRLEEAGPSPGWRLEEGPLDTLRQRLAAGRYEATLTSLGPPEAGHQQVELGTDRQALAAAKAGAPRGEITPRVLARTPLIVRVHCEQLQSASRILDDWHVSPLIVARTESDAHALELVAAGLGMCLMPDSFSHPDVVFVRPKGVELKRRIGLEWIRGAAGGWFDTFAPALAATNAG